MSLPHTLLVALLFVVASCGCERSGDQSAEQLEPDSTSTVDASDTPDEDTVSGTTPQRIVSLAPSVTETLFALGAGDRVVAVTRFCDFPAEVSSLPKIGGLTDVDVEMVVSLRPDLVIGVDNKTASSLSRTLERAEVESLFVPVETLEQVAASISAIGARVGAAEKANALAAPLEVEPKEATDGPDALVLLGKAPWIGAGEGTFADEMLAAAGAKNVLAGSNSYPTLDAERLASLQPDIVFDTSFGKPDEELTVAGDPTVVRVDPALMRPGPRLARAIEQFRTAVEAHRGE